MIFGKTKKQERIDSSRYDLAAGKLYEAAMARSRIPSFYKEKGIPDTVDGRFELLVLHMFLLWDRFDQEEENKLAALDLSQALFDVMFRAIDSNLRMAGVGDLGVPKHVKRMMKAYKGRCMAYRDALDCEDTQALTVVLARNLFGTVATPQNACLDYFSVYIQSCRQALSQQPFAALSQGEVSWADTDF